MRVIVDIDDVLMPWAETVHQACAAAGLNPNGVEWSQWHQWEDYGCTKDQWLEVVNSLVEPGGLYHAPPYPGAAEALRRLHWEGHQIHLVTARGFFDHAEQIRAWTVDWVHDFAIPGELIFAQDKGAIARSLDATHGVDDRLENFLDLRKAGVEAYLVTQPHNRAAPVPDHRRVNSVTEFVDTILEEA